MASLRPFDKLLPLAIGLLFCYIRVIFQHNGGQQSALITLETKIFVYFIEVVAEIDPDRLEVHPIEVDVDFLLHCDDR